MDIKATGIIRRIDDLGRIVIPKEIRRQMEIKEGDPFELCILNTDNEKIVAYRKYTVVRDRLAQFARQMMNIFERRGHSETVIALVDSLGCVMASSRGMWHNELLLHQVGSVITDQKADVEYSVIKKVGFQYGDDEYCLLVMKNWMAEGKEAEQATDFALYMSDMLQLR